ncbi:MAG: rod shape-determining protein, partial [Candidatus Omnitrophica bacterium]|nr:rod shape-determining protein [Candidatus Omnitrophota bacterium]
TIKITSQEIRDALTEPISAIVESVRVILEKAPPELSADLVDQGIVLVGGGSLLRGIDKLLSEETGLPVRVAEEALTAVALGTGKYLSEIHNLKRMQSRRRIVTEQ